MPYKLRVFECAGCGQLVERNAPDGARVRCIHCAIGRSVENMTQLRNKSGPFYERWLQGIAAAITREQEWAAIAPQISDLDWPEGW